MTKLTVDVFGSSPRPDLGQDYTLEPTVSFSCNVADTSVETVSGIVGVFTGCKWFGVRSGDRWLFLSWRGYFCN